MMHSGGDYGGSGVPAFLHKLWTLVEDESTNELIAWDPSGRSFHVFDQGRFSKEVLPLYFKHNNIASFIRQLNMYGFRKVTSIDHGGLKVEKDDVEFIHQYFQRGQEHLLEHIKRKIANTQKTDDIKVKQDHVSKILLDVHNMKDKQDEVDTKMETLERENEALWREVANLRTKHHKQQQIVNKLIQFLVTMVGNRGLGVKRRMPLMIEEQHIPAKMARQYPFETETTSQPTIQVLTDDVEPTTTNSVTIEEMVDPRLLSVSEADRSEPPPNATILNPSQLQPNTSHQYMINLPSGTVLIPQQTSSVSVPTTTTSPGESLQVTAMPNIDFDTGLLPVTDDIYSDPVLPIPEPTPVVSRPPSNIVALPEPSTSVGPSAFSDVNDHLGFMDDSLENLKELLAGGEDKAIHAFPGLRLDLDTLLGVRLDADTLLGLFTPEGPVPPTPEGLLNLADDGKPDFSNATENATENLTGGELMEYRTPDEFGFNFDSDNFLDDTPHYLDDPGLGALNDDLNTPINFDVASPLAMRRKTKSRTISSEGVD